jgi:hypothetical protein
MDKTRYKAEIKKEEQQPYMYYYHSLYNIQKREKKANSSFFFPQKGTFSLKTQSQVEDLVWRITVNYEKPQQNQSMPDKFP